MQGNPSLQDEKLFAVHKSTSTASASQGIWKPDRLSKVDEQETLTFLLVVELFQHLYEEELPTLAAACERITYKPGQVMAKEGAEGSELVLILEGVGYAELDGEAIHTIGSGDYFGEMSLLFDIKWPWTLKAKTKLSALKLTRERFSKCGLDTRLHVPKLKTVRNSGVNMMPKRQPPSPKTEEDRLLIIKALRENQLLQEMFSLDDPQCERLADRFWKETVPADKKLCDPFEDDDEEAAYFYVVSEGTFQIIGDGASEPPTTPGRFSPAGRSNRTGGSKGSSVHFGMGMSPTESATGSRSVMAGAASAQSQTALSHSNESHRSIVTSPNSNSRISVGTRSTRHTCISGGASARSVESRISRKMTGQEEPKQVDYVSKGASFGEMALLYNAPPIVAVRAKVESVVWVIDRTSWRDILIEFAESRAQELIPSFANVEVLSALSWSEQESVAKALVEVMFSKGETIFRQGEDGDAFYILYDGEVCLIRDGVEVEDGRLLGSVSQPVVFGGKGLVSEEKRQATVQVLSEKAHCLSMDKISFTILMSPMEKNESLISAVTTRVSKVMNGPSSRQRITRAEVKSIGMLGRGNFGLVEFVEHVQTQDTYALKSVNKERILRAGAQERVFAEKDCMLKCTSAFILKLYETYVGPEHLLFLMEVALGGSLQTIYSRHKLWGKAGHTKFYIAGVVLALAHAHSKRIIHRDVKDENVLLSKDGYPKLCDFGLAKCVIGKTYTTCGTPDFMAPEMLTKVGYTRAVDWWAVGVLLYELSSANGFTPFRADNRKQIHRNAAFGIEEVVFPWKIRGPCRELIKSYCAEDPPERLPMKKGGVENIKSHEWYRNFEWQAFESRIMKPPFDPAVKDDHDLKNFGPVSTEEPRRKKREMCQDYIEPDPEWDKEFATNA